jgi:hypothetical protein
LTGVLKGEGRMPLVHVLWRLAEGKTATLHVQVTSACLWPGCALQRVELTLILDPAGPKPAVAICPLCQRDMRILAAAPASAKEI